jgi:hydroxymethylpyrimidine/phosphomethylpyrimidine kinase
MLAMAERLLKLGCGAVLLKGGHLDNADSADIFFDGNEPLQLSSIRIRTKNTHGTGCTLSSAVTAFLARGYELRDAVVAAKDYVSAAIAAADRLTIGHGHGPVHHFHAIWEQRS